MSGVTTIEKMVGRSFASHVSSDVVPTASAFTSTSR
jgi:hypothetical protein